MHSLCSLVFFSGLYPLGRAWVANRHSSLAHALAWAGAAWVAWGMALVLAADPGPGLWVARYLALCLPGCAGVAVLGARQPGVRAWNFVVLGLLAGLVLPLAESLLG